MMSIITSQHLAMSCKLNNLNRNGKTEKCELCENMDEMCFVSNRCNADYLQWVGRYVHVGGER